MVDSERTPKAFAGGAAPSWTAAALCPSSGLVCWLGCAAAVLGLSPGKGHTRAEEGRAKASSPVEAATPCPAPWTGREKGQDALSCGVYESLNFFYKPVIYKRMGRFSIHSSNNYFSSSS